ncbi:MAG: hypothetical protein M3R04_06555, partial [bacterium]|nr:hypothetical protein [bacterium]
GTFASQARAVLFPDAQRLSNDKKNLLLQKAIYVTNKMYDTHPPDLFPPPARVEFQAHWSSVLEGAVLPGPEWAMSPEEAADGRQARAAGQQPLQPPAAKTLTETVTDAPLTDKEQAVLDAVGDEFPDAFQVPTTVADEKLLQSVRGTEEAAVEVGTEREPE